MTTRLPMNLGQTHQGRQQVRLLPEDQRAAGTVPVVLGKALACGHCMLRVEHTWRFCGSCGTRIAWNRAVGGGGTP